eukprot:SAG11_NODE_8529_length_1005_cov_1.281457_2_plen_102_part_01
MSCVTVLPKFAPPLNRTSLLTLVRRKGAHNFCSATTSSSSRILLVVPRSIYSTIFFKVEYVYFIVGKRHEIVSVSLCIFSIKERVYYVHKNTTGKAESRTAN